MLEDDIKAEVLSWVRRSCCGRPLPVVASEFSLNGTGIRADLAVLDISFYGIEVKSAADTLRRLSNQMEGYARYFDRTVLVVDSKHLRGLADLDLKGAQVWSQSALSGHQLRRCDARSAVSGHTLLGLLTLEGERQASRALHAAQALLDQGVDVARVEFEKMFRRRYGSTSDAFWAAVRGRRITAADIGRLSRFAPDRERAREARDQQDAGWSSWALRIATLSQESGYPPQSSSVS